MSRPTGTVALVVNPTAGRGRSLALLPQVVGHLRDTGYAVEIGLSRTPQEAADLLASAASREVAAVVVMGGDGMFHLGVNAVARRRAEHADRAAPALGLIPAGTGNDLVRGVGLDPHDVVGAAETIAGGATRPLDLARVGDRYVGTVVATGFDALVNRRANAMRYPRGSARYTLAVLAEIRTFSPLEYRLTVDGQTRDLEAMLIAVGNTGSYGGGMQICPSADPFDAVLAVTVIHPVSRAKLLQLLPRMRSGRFVTDPCVEQLSGTRVSFEGPGLLGYGDGEQIGPAPLTVESCPAAIDLCVPG